MIEWAEVGREIEARERVAGIQDGMAAVGTMEKRARKRYMDRLDRAMRAPRPEPVAPRPTPKLGEPLSPSDAAIRAKGRAMLAGFGMPLMKASDDG